MKPAARAAELRRILEKANHAYYVLDKPDMSDAEYDKLFRELQDLEAKHPGLQTPDSPTLRIGGEPASGFRKHRHLVPMLSLANAFTEAELGEWEERNARLVPEVKTAGYTLEVKIDGAAVSLTYEDGVLATGVTRGNGVEGEDVTPNLRTVLDLPLRLRGKGWPKKMEVRGEVYLPKSQFAETNKQREKAGEPPYANPRNAAAGALRQLDSKKTRARGLRVFTFQVEAPGLKLGIDSQHELLKKLREWGLPVESHHTRVDDLAAAHKAIAKLEKFAPEVQVTKLLEIRINVGRTGALNPYAVLEPVEIGGVTVSNATLHNAELIAAKDIREGDWVEVTRAGEVIPQILGPVKDKRSSGLKPYKMPERCPSCGSQVEHPPDEVMTYCPNISCPSRILESIVHFAGRSAMDIRGLGYERVRALLDAKRIADVADLYELTPALLLTLEGFAEKSAQQLVDAIAASKQQPLSALLFALGIRHVGAQGAKLLARHFGTLKALSTAAAAEIGEVRGIGPAIAEAVAGFFKEPRNKELLKRFGDLGLTLQETATATGPRPLADQTYVVTGTLPTLSRQQARDLIEGAGGHVADSLSKKTTALVVGSDPGSKLDKAKALGVEQIDEAELLRRANRKP